MPQPCFHWKPHCVYNSLFTLNLTFSARTSNTPLKITDEGLKHFVMSITQNLSGLKQLTLGFVA